MDQATPSNFYLTLCLYVSFYFLFFSATTTVDDNNNNDTASKSSPFRFRIPTDQELKDKRRAKSFSEQLDPFLAATRKAQATKQVKDIAKARAKATLGTISGAYHSHSRHHSKQHSKQYSKGHSSSTATSKFSNTGNHLRQHSRQKSHHSQHHYDSYRINIPGSYFFNDNTSRKSASTEKATNNTPSVQAREYNHLHYQGQQKGSHLTDYFSPPHPQPNKQPPRSPRRFSRQNQKRYYHFSTEEPLIRKKKDMTAPATAITEQPPHAQAQAQPSQPNQGWNGNKVVQSVEAREQQHRRSSINWADEPLGQPSHSQTQAQQATLNRNSMSPDRYESKCHLEESVTPSTLLAHLRVLRMVQSLVIVDDEDLDFLFLIRSEERYLKFLDLLQQMEPPIHAVPLPPLDVALMWMVHMLAPFRYHEDLLRSYSPHLLNYAFPLERYVAAVDIENPTTHDDAFLTSKAMWLQLYPEEPFDLDKDDTSRMFEIECLWCGGTNVMDSSTFIKFRIDGMSIDCKGCGSQCSLQTLSSKRFWDGVEAYRADSSILLAGSILSPTTGIPDTVAAQREHHLLFFHPRIQFALDQASVSLNCTWPKVIQTFQDLGPDQYYGIRPTTLARTISSYMGLVEDRLSMDLVSGALRQRDFQKAMMVTGGLAWCQPQVLQRSLDRYKKFMVLARADNNHTGKSSAKLRRGSGITGMSSKAAGGGNLGAGQPGRHALVPTLDIDLAWHTHMLDPAHYRYYQLTHYGKVLNHDDTIQASSAMTKQDFMRTAELWQDLYQEKYSTQQMTWRKQGAMLTPGKLCAGVCFPPFGVYLLWKHWRSNKKARQANGGPGSEKKTKKTKQSKKSKRGNEETKTNKDTEKSKAEESSFKEKEGSLTYGDKNNDADSNNNNNSNQNCNNNSNNNINNGNGNNNGGNTTNKPGKRSELMIEELAVQDESLSSQQTQRHDVKGKGKVVSNDVHLDLNNNKNRTSSPDHGARNLTAGLGLDGRLSNWNGDAAGPAGQASCSSGACVMSPWNELQDLAPIVNLHQQPQQQRELRKERT